MQIEQAINETDTESLVAAEVRENIKVRKKNKSRLSTVFLIVLMLIGIGVMAYPTFSDWWNSMHASRAIASYSQTVAAADRTELDAMLAAAGAYNRQLAAKDNQYYMSDEEMALYNSLLDPGGTGLMAYVSIPSIRQNIPVYHGTDESVLQTAVGHLTWTSLPVGGESTHTVLSGHRGLPRAKLFTDIDRLSIGDVFTVTVLDQVLTYQVDQILVVLPEETEALTIIPGGDYCTLLTCTPYGINSHRLLVRGTRIETPEPVQKEDTVSDAATEPEFPLRLKILAFSSVILFVLLLLLLIRLLRKPNSGKADVHKKMQHK